MAVTIIINEANFDSIADNAVITRLGYNLYTDGDEEDGYVGGVLLEINQMTLRMTPEAYAEPEGGAYASEKGAAIQAGTLLKSDLVFPPEKSSTVTSSNGVVKVETRY